MSSDERAELIAKIHDQSFGTYCTRRVTAELRLDAFYNPTRRHSTLGYLGPIDF
jgi:transposase InsO family protein